MLRRPLAVLIAVVLPIVMASGAAAKPRPADSNPPGTVQLTPSTGGVDRYDENVLAGTSDAFAYLRFVTLDYGDQGSEIFVRTSSGSVTDLGPGPLAVDPDRRFSLVGTSLIKPSIDNSVQWWNTATRASGTITLPSDESALTAAPDGFVYEQGGTAYDEDVATGSSTSLGSLFGGASFEAVGGSSGLLATSGRAAKYLAWATPGQVSDIDTGGRSLICIAVEGDYAACVTSSTTGTSNPELLKLDGTSGPVALPPVSDSDLNTVALAGSTIVAVEQNGHLQSRSYTSPTVESSSGTFWPVITSAYGHVVVSSSSEQSVQTVTSATSTPVTLFTAPFAPVEAAAFDLSPGQIVDLDNRRNAADPPGRQSMIRTPVATDAAGLQVGTEGTVATGLSATPDTVGSPLASGTTTAIPGDYTPGARPGRPASESLTLSGPHRSHTITGVSVDLDNSPALSGNRLVYYAQDVPRPGFYLYDLAKNTTSLVLAINAKKTHDELPVPAVSGNYLAIMHTNGEVTQLNLNTGTSIVVSPPLRSFQPGAGGSVWERGDWIGWLRAKYIVDEDETVYVGGYRDVATHAAPVADDAIEGLAATGVIDFPIEIAAYALRLFDGGTVRLPQTTDSTYATGGLYPVPQIEGRTVAWYNSTQALFVAPLDLRPAPPRMEGDTLAPKPQMSSVKWHPYVPYSEPLTSCSATVTSGTQVVATLACNKAYMARGVADLVWDGKIESQAAPAGTYHYTITAAGDGGGALDSAGTTAPVAGHFTID